MRVRLISAIPEVGEDEQCDEQRYNRRAEADEVNQTRYEVVFILQ